MARRLRMAGSAVQLDEPATARLSLDEMHLVERLCDGDESAFELLVERYHVEMLALARVYVRTRQIAEEVVQETWLAVLNGIDRFEGRSSLKTWVFRILVNTATTRGVREARSFPVSALIDEGPAVDPERFHPDGIAFADEWRTVPSDWRALPEEILMSSETLDVVSRAIADLPPRQGQVIAMRDIVGFGPEEVSATLGVSRENQRILLHRARSRVRAALEAHFDD
jgi:RNA polymerase sigma-70 factor, ECF subfamily